MSLKTSKVDVTMCVSFRSSLDQLNFLENEKTQEKKNKTYHGTKMFSLMY